MRTPWRLRAVGSLGGVKGIMLLALGEEAMPASTRDDAARELPSVVLLDPVFHPVHLWRHLRHVPHVAWLRITRGVPYLAAKWDSQAVRGALERELGARSFDVVWLGSLGLARYLPLLRDLQPRARVVLDGHNVESEIWAQFASRQKGIWKRIAQAEWRRARDFERDALRAVDAVAAISQDDARAYRELAGITAQYVPQVVPFTRRSSSRSCETRLCYVGTLSWRPNVRGLDWFCREVWPRVRDRLPDATLDIAGSGLPTDGAGAAIAPPAWRVPGVNVLGFVEDVAPLYERSAAMIAPHLEGTGVRMKLLEAFRHGVPLVTTPAGAAGLPIDAGREAFVEADPRAFANAVVAVATDAGQQQRLRDAGFAFLERHHGLAAAQNALRGLLGLEAQAARSSVPLMDEGPRDGSGRSRRTELAFPRSH